MKLKNIVINTARTIFLTLGVICLLAILVFMMLSEMGFRFNILL